MKTTQKFETELLKQFLEDNLLQLYVFDIDEHRYAVPSYTWTFVSETIDPAIWKQQKKDDKRSTLFFTFEHYLTNCLDFDLFAAANLEDQLLMLEEIISPVRRQIKFGYLDIYRQFLQWQREKGGRKFLPKDAK